jgi:serine/threonine-protein kinase
MSPEQSAGDKEVDGRSDLYSLGVVAYQMLTGALPFIANSTPAMLVKHLSERPQPVSTKRAGIPADLAAAVMCLLEKNPADRFADARSLVDVLDGAGSIPKPSAVVPMPPHAWSPLPEPGAGPSAAELARWNAPPVAQFRRKFAPYLMVNSILFVIGIFTGFDLFATVASMWGICIAFKYAKLWSAGYDWRDVFRQPRERMIFDVVAEWIDDVRALFDRDKRAEVRARWQARRMTPGILDPPTPGSDPSFPAQSSLTQAELAVIGTQRAEVARRALQDRDELLHLVSTLPKSDRRQLKDIGETAKALADRVRHLSIALAELDRSTPVGGADTIDREIAQLESQANPLDRDASEARVRRLAALKRDRRGVGERGRRRADLEGKLESCALALQNLRFDVLRLKTGTGSTSNVTLIAERAASLAKDVDGMISARRDS